VAKLSETEMKETKGDGGLDGAAIGGLSGALGYTGYTLGSGKDFTWSGLGEWTTFGALAGSGVGSYSTIGRAAVDAYRYGARSFGAGYITGDTFY
jgi:hypothetical protein